MIGFHVPFSFLKFMDHHFIFPTTFLPEINSIPAAKSRFHICLFTNSGLNAWAFFVDRKLILQSVGKSLCDSLSSRRTSYQTADADVIYVGDHHELAGRPRCDADGCGGHVCLWSRHHEVYPPRIPFRPSVGHAASEETRAESVQELRETLVSAWRL